MSHCQNLQAILAELMADAQQIDGEEVNALGEAIMQAKRVFVAGAGRSGFAARAFANRLMHTGFSTVCGRTDHPIHSAGGFADHRIRLR